MSKLIAPFDLHASSTPSAFNLNQDQILKKKNRKSDIKKIVGQRSCDRCTHKHILLAHFTLLPLSKELSAALLGATVVFAFATCVACEDVYDYISALPFSAIFSFSFSYL